MQEQSVRWALWIAVASAFASLGGCEKPSLPNSEATARKWMTAELDKWVAGGESQAATYSFRIRTLAPPLSYKIRTLVPIEVKVPIDLLKKYEDVHQKLPAYRVVVDLDFRSEANTAIPKVGEYLLIWVEPDQNWYLDENM